MSNPEQVAGNTESTVEHLEMRANFMMQVYNVLFVLYCLNTIALNFKQVHVWLCN